MSYSVYDFVDDSDEEYQPPSHYNYDDHSHSHSHAHSRSHSQAEAPSLQSLQNAHQEHLGQIGGEKLKIQKGVKIATKTDMRPAVRPSPRGDAELPSVR